MPPKGRGSAARRSRGGSIKDRLNFSARGSPHNAAGKQQNQVSHNRPSSQYRHGKYAYTTKRNVYVTSHQQQQSTSGRSAYDPSKAWFKVTAFSGANIGKDLVINLIRDHVNGDNSSTPFKPYHVQEEGTSVVFYVCGERIKNIIFRSRINLPNQTKLSLKCTPNLPPMIDLKDDTVIQRIQSVMNGRYNVAERSLDLSGFRSDPAFVDSGLYVPISREPILEAVIKMIRDNEYMEQNLYKLSLSKNDLVRLSPLAMLSAKCLVLKHIDLSDNLIRRNEVGHLKDFTLDDLNLAGNPICRSFDTAADYVSFMRDQMKRLNRLDGHELPAVIGFDVGDTQLPPTLGSFVPDNVKQIVESFIVQYYKLFDSPSIDGSATCGTTRKDLAAGYHTDAMFSMSVVPPNEFGTPNEHHQQSSNSKGRPTTNMDNLMNENRNILKISNSSERLRLLRRKRDPIMATFSSLPSTRHLLETFVVDVPLVISEPVSLMQIVITGLFKDMSRNTAPLRAFMRNFTILPQPNGTGLLIFNDLWLIQSPTVDQVKRFNALKKTTVDMTPPPDASMSATGVATSSYVSPTNVSIQEVAVREIMEKTRMNRGFSYKLLTEENWDASMALELFRQLFAAGRIPAEAFQPDGL